MTIQYIWDVKEQNNKKIDGKDVITNVFWQLTGSDGVNEVVLDKWQDIEYNPDASFIDYKDVTKETVLAWLKQSMGERWDNFEAMIDANFVRIANEANNPKLDLPWGIK
jgi:hypothetical protein